MARNIVQRVIGALILAGIFALLSNCAKAVTTSGNGASATVTAVSDVANNRWVITVTCTTVGSYQGRAHWVDTNTTAGNLESVPFPSGFDGYSYAPGGTFYLAKNSGNNYLGLLVAITNVGAYQQEFVDWNATPNPVQGAPTVKKSDPQQVANPYNKPLQVVYTDSVTGAVLGSEIINAGQTGMFVLASDTGNAINVQYTLPEGGAYVGQDSNGNSVGYILNSGATWSGTQIPSSALYTTPPVFSSPNTPTIAAPVTSSNMTTTAAALAAGASTGAGVRTVTVGTAGNVQYTGTGAGTGGVTDTTFREGTGAIVGELQGIKKAVGGTGSGSVSMAGVESRLDTANEHLTKVADVLTGNSESQGQYSNSEQVGLAQAAAAGVEAYDGIKPTINAAPTVGGLGTSVTSWGSAFHIGSTSLQFGLGSSFGGSHALMVAGRSLLLAACCLGFLRGCSGSLTTYTAALPQVQAQDTNVGPENLIPGSSQAKTWGTAATAVLTIFGGAAALVAIADTMVTYFGGGIATIFNALSFPGGMAAAAIDQYVPLAAMMSLTILGAAVPYAMAPVYLATSAVLRFLKT